MMIRFSTIACVTLVAGLGFIANAFSVPGSAVRTNKVSALYMQPENDPVSGESNSLESLPFAAAASAAMWSALPNMSMAAGPDWGLFEGKTGSLLHPIAMAGLLFYSLYTGYLGLQFRRQRELGSEISDLRKLLPKVEAASISDALQQEDLAPSDKLALQKGLEVEAQISDLTAERKELSSKGLRDQHFNQGALLAFIGTFFAIEVSSSNAGEKVVRLFVCSHFTQTFFEIFCHPKGPSQYICQSWKAFPRSTLVCRCWSSCSLGSSSSLCPSYAKRKRHCTIHTHWCKRCRNWSFLLASRFRSPYLVQSLGKDSMALNTKCETI